MSALEALKSQQSVCALNKTRTSRELRNKVCNGTREEASDEARDKGCETREE